MFGYHGQRKRAAPGWRPVCPVRCGGPNQRQFASVRKSRISWCSPGYPAEANRSLVQPKSLTSSVDPHGQLAREVPNVRVSLWTKRAGLAKLPWRAIFDATTQSKMDRPGHLIFETDFARHGMIQCRQFHCERADKVEFSPGPSPRSS